jgi:predicted MFS family arabinose efflux permease
LLPPVFQTRVTRLAAPAVRDAAGAVAVTALNVGIAAGAALGGVVLARSGPAGLVLAATAVATAGALVLVPRRPRRPRWLRRGTAEHGCGHDGARADTHARADRGGLRRVRR